MRYSLTVRLLSDATFSRGEGVPGLVDIEVEHDALGCPQIGGRTLKGLLVEEWANLRYALEQIGRPVAPWDATAATLFGTSGAGDAGGGRLHVGAATLPPDLRAALAHAGLAPGQILSSLTTIRRQTSVNAVTGAPQDGSLRAARAVLRGIDLIAPLELRLPDAAPERPLCEALLAACALAVRRGGISRNRGRGRIALLLHAAEPTDYRDATFTRTCVAHFAAQVHP